MSKINSYKTESFNKTLNNLPKEIQEVAKQSFLKWKDNPSSVHFKPLAQADNQVYSAQVNSRYRALAKKSTNAEGQTCYTWFWVGSHEDYNNLIFRLKNVIKNIDTVRRSFSEEPNNSTVNKNKI